MCDRVDQDCNGFADDGRLGLSEPVGFFAPGGALSSDRAVAVAWRDAANGGALLVYRDAGRPGAGNQILSFATFDRGGARSSDFFWTVSSSTAVDRPTGQAALAWDGAQWVVWYGYESADFTVRRATITPGPDGALSDQGIEASGYGVRSLAAVAAPDGAVGVVFTTPTEVRTGVWRSADWHRAPSASITARTELAGAAIVARSTDFIAVTADTRGRSAGIVLQAFGATGTGFVFDAHRGDGFVEPQAVFEPSTGRLILGWQAGGDMQALRWDATAGVPVGSVVTVGPGRLARVAAADGDIFVAPGPDLRRLQRDLGTVSVESIAPGILVHAMLGTPGSSLQSALVWHGTPAGVVSRAVRCP
jgi:hypothetical protein